jgi:hypothetical protein
MVSGHDARHRRPAGLIHQALQTSQVLSFRETLYSMGIGEIGDNLLPRDLLQQEQDREVVQGNEGKDQEVPQQHKREDTEEPRRAGNCNCSNAQHHPTRMKRGNTNLTVPILLWRRSL